ARLRRIEAGWCAAQAARREPHQRDGMEGVDRATRGHRVDLRVVRRALGARVQVTSKITQWGKASRWYIKLPAKVTLTYLPGGRPLSSKLGVFTRGPMLTADYAIESFDTHFGRVADASKREGFTCLEVGPGESVSSAVVACARGAAKTLLVDVAPFASTDIA